MRTASCLVIMLAQAAGLLAAASQASALVLAPPPDQMAAELGKLIFFDPDLSINGTQNCASCHGPEVGFSGPDSAVNEYGAVEPGAVPGRFGNRRPPVAAYAGDSPLLQYDTQKGQWFGGMFWDGRATGWTLGDPLAEQAMGPFLNPLEMAMPGARQVCLAVARSDYAGLFEEVWGEGTLDCAKDAAGAYQKIATSIAAYERSPEVNPFTSKFDLFYDNARAAGKDITRITAAGIPGGGMGSGTGPGGGMIGGGMESEGTGCGGGMGGGGIAPENNPARWEYYRGLGLTDEELQGLAIFNDSNRADCASCHTLTPGTDGYPLFTDFSYHNIGIPANLDNPFYDLPRKWNPDGDSWVDAGLGGFLRNAGFPAEVWEPEAGKFKTPSLRNVDLRPSPDFVKTYGHNGYFKSLDGFDGIIHFYAWRAMMDSGMGGGMGDGMGPNPNLFPPPELDQNRVLMQPFSFMKDGQKIAAFLKTLSDGYFER